VEVALNLFVRFRGRRQGPAGQFSRSRPGALKGDVEDVGDRAVVEDVIHFARSLDERLPVAVRGDLAVAAVRGVDGERPLLDNDGCASGMRMPAGGPARVRGSSLVVSLPAKGCSDRSEVRLSCWSAVGILARLRVVGEHTHARGPRVGGCDGIRVGSSSGGGSGHDGERYGRQQHQGGFHRFLGALGPRPSKPLPATTVRRRLRVVHGPDGPPLEAASIVATAPADWLAARITPAS
jgi:hypothetical protein